MWHWMKHRLLSPRQFYATSRWLVPLFAVAFGITLITGLVGGLCLAPPDYQQGEGFRIIYVHVPAAFTAMSIYAAMAIAAAITLIWRIKVAAICLSCSARIGVWFTLLALVTGALWGKPMWGTFWVWDARLTSVLVLFFLYLGFIALESVIPDITQRERATAVLALAGSLNLPVIHYSVLWWNTLHQGPSLSQFAVPAIAPAMLWPLLIMIASFQCFYLWILCFRMRDQILWRERHSVWAKETLSRAPA